MTAAAINTFCREIGITRNENVIPMHKLEHHVRSDLDTNSPRTLAVLRPLKVCGFNQKFSNQISAFGKGFARYQERRHAGGAAATQNVFDAEVWKDVA